MLNVAIIMGRLTRDPELRRTNSGKPVACFTVAVDRDYAPEGQEKETDFIDCVAWNGTAEFVDKYFKKGSTSVPQIGVTLPAITFQYAFDIRFLYLFFMPPDACSPVHTVQHHMHMYVLPQGNHLPFTIKYSAAPTLRSPLQRRSIAALPAAL